MYKNRCGVVDWDTALAWIKGGKNKNLLNTVGTTRSLYEQGYRTRLQQLSSDEIAVVWCGQIIVIYRSDGLTIIQTSQWWQSARMALMRYAPVEVYVRKGRGVIWTPGDGYSPTKLQTCRTCKGYGKVDYWCSGPNDHCFDPNCELVIKRKALMAAGVAFWDDQVRELMHTKSVHSPTCQHGSESSHLAVRGTDCYRCVGSGKCNYGGKKRGRLWDGSPIGIDTNGNYVDVTGGN